MSRSAPTLLLLCLIFLASTDRAVIAAPAQLNLAELTALARARREQLTAIKLNFHTVQSTASPDAAKPIPEISRRMLVDLTTGRYRMARAMPGMDGDKQVHEAQFGHDGQTETVYIAQAKQGVIANRPPNIGLKGELLPITALLAFAPEPDGHGPDDCSLESMLKNGVVRDRLEVLGDRSCQVVDAQVNGLRYATVWLDVERGAMPVKFVLYGKSGEESAVQQIVQTAAFPDSRGGVMWLPLAIERSMLIRGAQVSATATVDAESVVINPDLTNESFRVTFPEGTWINDDIGKIGYRLPSGSDFDASIHSLGDEPDNGATSPAITSTDSSPDVSSSADPHRNNDGQASRTQSYAAAATIFGAIIVLLLVICSLLGWRKRKPGGVAK